MMLAALLFAAIITERNDVYNGAGCYTPPAYTFIGTSSVPGIDSCWIPYGTYTDGVGGTEHTRVTSNLMGVVASILGGAAERAYAIGGYYSPIVGDRFGDWPTLLRPITTPPQSWDRGEYLETATNTSLRIADQLNLGILYMRPWAESGTYYYPVYPESIEPLLAKTDNYYGHYKFNGGLASSFGSRRLDDMTGNVEPPISSEWSSKIPWSVSDADIWRFVHPVYGKCTNDIHFLPEGGYFGNVLPNPFDTSGDPMALWGHDADEAFAELNNACTNPLPVTIEDVLSADTGWKDDDYTHWQNMTTRLDWKRLGIICQLERQMETTYRNFANTDELPYYNISADHSILYRSDVEVPLPIPDRNGQTETVRGVFSHATWVEDKDQESYHSETNDLGWCRPTCRVPAPSSAPGSTFDPLGGHPVQIDDEKLEEVIADLCAQWTNNLVLASFYGKWRPLEENGLGLIYTANFMEGWVNVAHPSNTVAASTSDGFHYFEWRETPIAQDEWRSEDGFYFNIHNSANGGCVNLRYSSYTNDYWSIGYYNEGFDLFNGDIVIPQVTFTATESEGNPSNWIWQVSGIDGLASNTASSISWGDDNTKRWLWYRNGTDDAAAMIEANYIGDTTFRYMEFNIFSRGGFGMYYYSMLSSGPFPRVYTTKTLDASWRTSSYTQEEFVDSYSPLNYYAVSVDPLTETNGTFGVTAGLTKHSSAAFTLATSERRDETIARFYPYYNAYDWVRIKNLRRSELDLLLSCSGSDSMADSTDPWDGFLWQNLRQRSGSGRLFRFVSGTDAYNRQSAENARYNLLSDLSAKCKSKCTELGGMPIVSMETYGKIAEKEKAALKNDLKSARVEARFLLKGIEIDDFYIEAAVHWDENKPGYVVDQINWPVNPPYTIGYYDWNMIVDCDFSSISNQYRSARADAHQAPVEKTLWKFKNLRDPNL